MSESKQFDKVLCHAYDIKPLDLDISSASWSETAKADFADTARYVVCRFEDFHSTVTQIPCQDLLTGKTVYVSRNSLILVAKDLEAKRKMVLADIDGVLTSFDKGLNATLLDDGTYSQYTNLVDSHRAKPTYVFNILCGISQNADIGFLTARGESQRVVTHLFLNDNTNSDFLLFMRGFGDNEISAESLKVRMLQSCILPYYDVVCFIEDTVKNVAKVERILPHIKTMLVKN